MTHSRPKNQKTRGRNNVARNEIPGGGWATVNPEPTPFGEASHHRNETSASPTPAHVGTSGRSYNQDPAGPAHQYKSRNVVMEDVALRQSERGGAEGYGGGSGQGKQEREFRPPVNRPQQQNHPRPQKVRPVQNQTGNHGKPIQTWQDDFPLDATSLGVSRTRSDSAIDGQEISSSQKLFYGAHIGNETRNIEFKRGQGDYLVSSFRGHLRRYACAFLNSGGGSLLVGVDDNGLVCGLHLNHRQEDQARLLVDSIMKGFHPPLLPHSYSLLLLPVVRPGPEGCRLKVLCLTFRAPPDFTQPGLYQTDQGEVFLRRDGSVEGPLSASAIQEWARQRWSGEVNQLQQSVDILRSDQRFLLQELCRQNQTISALLNTAPRRAQKRLTTGRTLKWKRGSASGQNSRYPASTGPFPPLAPAGAPSGGVTAHDTGALNLILGSPPPPGHPRGPGLPQYQHTGWGNTDALISSICKLM